jgi:type III secretion protein W
MADKTGGETLQKVTDFLLQSLGSDLRSGGPSIEPALLQGLVTQTRALQSVLGVFSFFEKRRKLLQSEAGRKEITLPATVTIEGLTKAFMELVDDKYPSPMKVFGAAQKVGITDADPHSQVLVMSQFRDALRGVSPRFFPQPKTRDDLSIAILDALDQVETRLDQMEAQ